MGRKRTRKPSGSFAEQEAMYRMVALYARMGRHQAIKLFAARGTPGQAGLR